MSSEPGTLGRSAGADGLELRGFTDHEMEAAERVVAGSARLSDAFAPAIIGEGFVRDVLGASPEIIAQPDFDTLALAGVPPEQIAEAEAIVLGAGTLADAPFMTEAQRLVFLGATEVSLQARLAMILAIQPFAQAPPVAVLDLD